MYPRDRSHWLQKELEERAKREVKIKGLSKKDQKKVRSIDKEISGHEERIRKLEAKRAAILSKSKER